MTLNSSSRFRLILFVRSSRISATRSFPRGAVDDGRPRCGQLHSHPRRRYQFLLAAFAVFADAAANTLSLLTMGEDVAAAEGVEVTSAPALRRS